jgi:hypothetical protein
MKRSLVLLGTFFVCGILSGCSSDSREDAINGVVTRMTQAASDTNAIKDKIKTAVDKHKKEQTPLDLSDAMTATKSLEETGKLLQALKNKDIDQLKPADEDQKAELAKRFRTPIVTAYTSLVTARNELNDALREAEAIDARKTDELRKKIRDAEAPFDALTRQQG